MRVILQRVSRASVRVENKIVGAIEETGYLALVGITHEDGEAQLAKMADKTANLRLFDGEKSALEVDAPVLAVSQFTLYGDAKKAGARRGRKRLRALSASRFLRLLSRSSALSGSVLKQEFSVPICRLNSLMTDR